MKNLSHDAAIDALCGCAASVSVLSYQEAIEGYFKLRGLPIPVDGSDTQVSKYSELADKTQKQFELWFFRECNEGTRRHLFAIAGYPVEEITNHGTERIVLRRMIKALSKAADAQVSSLVSALRESEEALRDHACHGGPSSPCLRSADQCKTECGKQAGDALIVVLAALDGMGSKENG